MTVRVMGWMRGTTTSCGICRAHSSTCVPTFGLCTIIPGRKSQFEGFTCQTNDGHLACSCGELKINLDHPMSGNCLRGLSKLHTWRSTALQRVRMRPAMMAPPALSTMSNKARRIRVAF
ncbi:unnamed protein product, partial [Ixodes persulcatus]